MPFKTTAPARPPVKSWSYSRYADYKRCPAYFSYKHLDKLPEPKGPAMQRGIDIHEMADQYIKGLIKKLPMELARFESEFARLRAVYKASNSAKSKIAGMVAEDNWAFTEDWEVTTWRDFVSCWVRIKLDCAEHKTSDTVCVTDFKTGRFNNFNVVAYAEQLELYALAAFLMYPWVQHVHVRLLFLDHGIEYPSPAAPGVSEQLTSYVREDLPSLKKIWAKRVKPMFVDKTFAPRANGLCGYCNFSKAKDGPCKF
jgi:hypothetical protein